MHLNEPGLVQRPKLTLNGPKRTTDTETMTLRDALSIAIPAIALIGIIFAAPGEMRWSRRPWFIKGPPRRGPMAAFFAVFLVAAVARVLF